SYYPSRTPRATGGIAQTSEQDQRRSDRLSERDGAEASADRVRLAQGGRQERGHQADAGLALQAKGKTGQRKGTQKIRRALYRSGRRRTGRQQGHDEKESPGRHGT